MARVTERVIVWGGGGHGRVVAELVRASGHIVLAYADRNASQQDSREPAVVVAEEQLVAAARANRLPFGATAVALGIGDNAARAAALEGLSGILVPAYSHPSAIVSPSATLGRGTVVLPQAVINANAYLEDAVIVNSGAVVEHDCVLGSAVHVSPNATLTGGVNIGARSWIGAGAVVLPGIVIGRDAVIGAGAVVTRDVGEGETVVGVPARAARPTPA